MVHKAADGCVHVAGGHGAHQVKAHVHHVHSAVISAVSLHHGLDQSLAQCGAGITNGLVFQICGSGDVLILQRENDVQRRLHNGADGLHAHILVSHSLNDVVLVVHTDFSLACCHQRQCIVGVGGELHLYIQTLLSIVAFFNGSINEGVDCIGVPVQHHVDFPQVIGFGVGIGVRGFRFLIAAAGKQSHHHGSGQRQSAYFFELHIKYSFPIPGHCPVNGFLSLRLRFATPSDDSFFQHGDNARENHCHHAQQQNGCKYPRTV